MSEKDTPDHTPSETPKKIIEFPEESIKIIAKQISAVLIKKEQQFYRGPLPPLEMLKGYEEVCPGAADRMIKLTETRMRQEGTNSTYEFICTIAGQLLGFISFALLLGAGFWIAYTAKEGYQIWFALACLALPAMGALRKLIDGRRSN